MKHDAFKIIANGRELPYPVLRLVGLLAFMWGWGFLNGLWVNLKFYLMP